MASLLQPLWNQKQAQSLSRLKAAFTRYGMWSTNDDVEIVPNRKFTSASFKLRTKKSVSPLLLPY